MDNEVERLPILRLTEESESNIDDIFAREFPLTIILNDQELVTLLCSPEDINYLAVGFLFSEGLLKDKSEIKKTVVNGRRGVVRVETEEGEELDRDVLFKRFITSGCGKGASFYNAADISIQRVESQVKISPSDVFVLVNDFQHHSQVYRATGGVHSAALCDSKNILVFSEDIGRHNAIDKIMGKCLLEDIPINDRLVITSGRITSEILHKIAKRSVPIIISISAPTNLGVKVADDLGVTLISSVRGKRMNVCTNDWRVIRDDH